MAWNHGDPSPQILRCFRLFWPLLMRRQSGMARPHLSSKPATTSRWEYPEKSGIYINEKTNKSGGKAFGTSYRVIVPTSVTSRTGYRAEKQCKTLKDAKAWAEEQLLAYGNHGRSFTALPAQAQRDAITAWAKLSEHGIGFIEAAEAAIRYLRPAGGKKTVTEVIAELKASKATRKERGELRGRSMEDFRLRSAKVEGRFGTRHINTLTEGEVAAWLKELATTGNNGRPLSPISVRHYAQGLSEICRYAVAKRYCLENPLDHITREEKAATMGKTAKRGDINILTGEEAKRLLEAAKAQPGQKYLASTILRLFCGLRTEEVTRLSWHDVRWQEESPYVHISEQIAKGHAARNVTIAQNALEWLTLCPTKEGKIVPQNSSRPYCRAFRALVVAAKLPTKDAKGKALQHRNATRHSFASYHFAMHGDSISTSKELGHRQGDTLLFNHYRRLVTKAEGERFFALSPNAKAAGKVTPFAATA